ncbi:MAG: ABC transporter ATP-binding protein [Acidobacteria bacterium]|nr:ABC transporter ATP-binding protein [Acidobacteriota bacterium]
MTQVTTSARTVVHIEQVHRTYRTGDIEVRALRGVSLEVAAGEMVAVMGPSGSGKSTLMNIIGCLDRPTRGRYELEGRDVSTLTRDELAEVRNAKIGFIFQSLNLVARTSAIENVALPLVYAGVPQEAQMRRAREALAAVNLSDKERSLPNQLSGGQQQRVAIARALVNNPAIIIADEPTGALDTRSSLEVMEILERMNRERGLTILLVTHEHDIARHAQRLINIRDGRVNQDVAVASQLRSSELLAAMPPEEAEDVSALRVS